MKLNRTQHWPLGYTACYWPPDGLCTTHHHHQAIQPNFSPPVSLSIPYTKSFLCEDLMGDSLPEVTVENINCSPLIYQASHHRTLPCQWSMTFPLWIHVYYSWWPCHLCAWKWFPGLVAPSPSEDPRWGWPAYGSAGPPCHFEGRRDIWMSSLSQCPWVSFTVLRLTIYAG